MPPCQLRLRGGAECKQVLQVIFWFYYSYSHNWRKYFFVIWKEFFFFCNSQNLSLNKGKKESGCENLKVLKKVSKAPSVNVSWINPLLLARRMYWAKNSARERTARYDAALHWNTTCVLFWLQPSAPKLHNCVHYNSHYIVLCCAHPGGTLNISAAHKCIWCAVV